MSKNVESHKIDLDFVKLDEEKHAIVFHYEGDLDDSTIVLKEVTKMLKLCLKKLSQRKKDSEL